MNLLTLFILLNSLSLTFTAHNIVMIIADDLDIVLNGIKPLKNIQHLIGENGMTFTNCFVASPICCPNRASILTGRYQHNHQTLNNSLNGGCSNISWQNLHEPSTFAAYLKEHMGYITFYAGKYLNQYGHKNAGGSAHVPTGWDWWAGLIGNSKYYNYSLSINGTKEEHGDNSSDYLTDVISNLAVEFINGRSSFEEPFLMVLAPPAPHAPFEPAKRHIDKYKDIKAMRTPNFNTSPQRGKHWLVRRGPSPLPDSLLPSLDDIYRRRWETLLAVDELVVNVYQILKLTEQLKDTYIIFTSDNGYHIGQFSLPIDKRQPYETDVRVPLLIRGPGIMPSEVSAPVSSVDLFATILDMAGLEKPSDGISLLKHNMSEDRTLLIEYRGEKSESTPTSGCPSDKDANLTLCSMEMACKCQDAANNTFSCIRRVSSKHNNIFCVFEDNQNFIEAYDLNNDKYQLNNIGYNMKQTTRYKFRKRLKKMTGCKDTKCMFTHPPYTNI